MKSVLSEILKLRGGAPIAVDHTNSNRYRLVVNEKDGSQTAYYFSTPIYNNQSRKLVDIRFHAEGSNIHAAGSNADITVSADSILMKNAEGACTIELGQKPMYVSEQEVHSGGNVIIPTTNGIAIKCDISGGAFSFVAEAGQPFWKVRVNDRSFAIMKKRFRPYVVFSCIGALDADGNVTTPAVMEYRRLAGRRYCITVSPTDTAAKYVLIECNMYENKLLQDTTVESKNPSVNNAFGSVGFIGNTAEYGEQWLYSKLDYSKLPEMQDKHIRKAVLHMPMLGGKGGISACEVKSRFCSFGSKWSNKIEGSEFAATAMVNNGYQSGDITALLTDSGTGSLAQSYGVILKPKAKGKGFVAVATGDSYLAPQILEVNFEKRKYYF